MDSKHTPRNEPQLTESSLAGSSTDSDATSALEALASLDPAEAPEAADQIADRLGAALEEVNILSPRAEPEPPNGATTEEAGDVTT